MKRHLILFLILLKSFSLLSQTAYLNDSTKNKFPIEIKVTIAGADPKGALIIITKNGKPYKIINYEGVKYFQTLDFNGNYLIKCSKEGYVTKVIYFNTTIPKGREKREFAKFDLEVQLHKEIEGEKTKPNKPVGGVKYDSKLQDFDIYLGRYAKRIAKNKLKRFGKSIQEYTKIIELEPNNVEAYIDRGYYKDALGNFKEAIADYDTAITMDSTNAEAYFKRGYSKDRLKDYVGANIDYSYAIKFKADHVAAYYNRGLNKVELKDVSGGIEDFDKVIEIASNYSAAYYSRGWAKYSYGDIEGACADWSKGLSLGDIDSSNDKAKHCR